MQKKKQKKHDDFVDDGRTIADMSGDSRPTLFGHMDEFPTRKENAQAPEEEPADFRVEDDGEGEVIYDKDEAPRRDPPPPAQLSREDRRSYILGALGAGMLLVFVFIVGLGLVILLLLALWS